MLFQVYYEDVLRTPTSEKVVVETVLDESSLESKPSLTLTEKRELGTRTSVEKPDGVPGQFSFNRPHPPVATSSFAEVNTDLRSMMRRMQGEVARLTRVVEEQGNELIDQSHLVQSQKSKIAMLERMSDDHFKRYTKLKGELDDGLRSARVSAVSVTAVAEEVRREIQLMGSSLQSVEDLAQDAMAQAKSADSGTNHLAQRMRSGGSIRFHNRSFGSPEEFISFCATNRIVTACSADAFLLMNMDRNQVVAEAESLKNRKGRTDTHVGTGIESLFVSSFDTSFPATLSPSKTSVGDAASTVQVLKKLLKDAKVWESEDGSEGVKHAVEESAATISVRIETFAEQAGMCVHGQQFCGKLMADSYKFVNNLVSFLTRFYQSYLKLSGMKESTLWELCLDILGHILREIVSVRNAYVDSAASEPAMYYWGMLKAWQVQQRYLGNKFIDDPALTGILVRRALLRKDEAVAQMEKDLRMVQGKLAALKPAGK